MEQMFVLCIVYHTPCRLGYCQLSFHKWPVTQLSTMHILHSSSRLEASHNCYTPQSHCIHKRWWSCRTYEYARVLYKHSPECTGWPAANGAQLRRLSDVWHWSPITCINTSVYIGHYITHTKSPPLETCGKEVPLFSTLSSLYIPYNSRASRFQFCCRRNLIKLVILVFCIEW